MNFGPDRELIDLERAFVRHLVTDAKGDPALACRMAGFRSAADAPYLMGDPAVQAAIRAASPARFLEVLPTKAPIPPTSAELVEERERIGRENERLEAAESRRMENEAREQGRRAATRFNNRGQSSTVESAGPTSDPYEQGRRAAARFNRGR